MGDPLVVTKSWPLSLDGHQSVISYFNNAENAARFVASFDDLG